MEFCPICESILTPSLTVNGFVIGECDECNFLAVMDEVIPSELKEIYSEEYYERHQTRYIEVTQKQLNVWIRRMRVIEEMRSKQNLDKTLFDIGCGPGIFLRVAQEFGWEVYGTDISMEALSHARKVVGPNRIFEDLFAIDTTKRFDVITIWAVIEHLDDPTVYLEKIHSLLKPGGILALATVSTDAWNRRFYNENWRYFTPPEHLVFFNLNNLQRFLKQMGFHPILLNTHFNELAFWHSFPLGALHNHALPFRLFKKSFVLPLKITAKMFKAGDIIEAFAVRIEN